MKKPAKGQGSLDMAQFLFCSLFCAPATGYIPSVHEWASDGFDDDESSFPDGTERDPANLRRGAGRDADRGPD
jgi:hypothetical protein